ncbi:glycosyltransferase [Mycolicibacterium litorale]|nr:glycosyltransferase [Mycolicibacterium litorale]
MAIIGHLTEEVVFFSSAPRPRELDSDVGWVQLPLDVPGGEGQVADPTANGRLHWAPLRVDGLADRSAVLVNAIATLRPRRMVVDVSVEVALLCRLAGVPVTVMAMPGERGDAVHGLGYDIADEIVAPWSSEVYRPDWLARHDGKTHYVGVISRFEGAPLATPSPSRPTTGLLLAGAGGSTAPADALDQLRRGAPDFRWVAAGGDAGWVEELWPLLSGAGVVVTHAGQSAIADVAAASVAAVVIPQHRPFGEQHSTAAALADAGVVATAPVWPRPDEWAPLITTARARSTGDQWRRLQGAGAAARAAAVIAA